MFVTMALATLMTPTGSWAQKVTSFTTTEATSWAKGKSVMATKAAGNVVAAVDANSHGTRFVGFGTTFNELDWDAFNLLTRQEQDELMYRLFAPEGDLKFTHGRVSMNANDYARAWYSCDDVAGDFALRYFNIDHDKRNIIPLARAAQKYQPALQLFMSPWSPPVWMKINHDYPVSPSNTNQMDERQAYLLYMDDGRQVDAEEMKLLGDRKGVFPRRLASQDYFIQDPRYLQCYADMFCRCRRAGRRCMCRRSWALPSPGPTAMPCPRPRPFSCGCGKTTAPGTPFPWAWCPPGRRRTVSRTWP